MKKVILFTLPLYLLTFIVYAFLPFGETNIIVEKVLYEFFAILALLNGIYAVYLFGLKGVRARALVCILLGVLFWILGDTVWNYYQFTSSEIPFPSLGDYFYLFGYPIMFWGLLQEFRFSSINLAKIKATTKVSISLFCVLLLGLFSYISIYLTYSPEATLHENIVTIGYGVGDILLVISSLFLFLLIREYKGGKIARMWSFLFIAFSIAMAADILYGIYTSEYLEGTGIIKLVIDNLYIISFIFVICSFEVLKISITEMKKVILRVSKNHNEVI